jgi:hypothetical protein
MAYGRNCSARKPGADGGAGDRSPLNDTYYLQSMARKRELRRAVDGTYRLAQSVWNTGLIPMESEPSDD